MDNYQQKQKQNLVEETRIIFITLDKLYEPHYNPNKHPQEDIENLAESLKAFGQRRTISVWSNPEDPDGRYEVLAGNGIVRGAALAGLSGLLCTLAPPDWNELTRKAYTLADNQRNSILDEGAVAAILEEVSRDSQLQLEAMGYSRQKMDDLLAELANRTLSLDDLTNQSGEAEDTNQSGEAEAVEQAVITLRDRFVVPPFSILDSRQGYWMERKRAWEKLIGLSVYGRGNENETETSQGGLIFSNSSQPIQAYKEKEQIEKIHGTMSWERFLKEFSTTYSHLGTSEFDPVLAEIAYTWFCPPNARIIDPFAGGSVRGLVAAVLGHSYTGIDLSLRQIEANEKQWLKYQKRLGSLKNPTSWKELHQAGVTAKPNWLVGDSSRLKELPGAGSPDQHQYDFVFSCPPYADLEVYSDDPKDLSNMSYSAFRQTLRQVIEQACALLKNDRFACFVVGEVRDKKSGYYRNFVSDTIQAFLDSGLGYYNEGILINPYGSVVIRVGGYFVGNRKLGKTHQNVLVFVKGDWRKAAEACGPLEVKLPTDFENLEELEELEEVKAELASAEEVEEEEEEKGLD